MKVIEFQEYGSPGVLRLAEREKPQAGEGMALVRVRAAGVNPADIKWRAGMFKAHVPLSFPHVPGYDIAGVVAAIGPGSSQFAIGQRVFAMLNSYSMGGYAEFAVVPENILASMSDGLDFAAAAALPTAALTGVQMIETQIDARRGDVILVTGACGAVGRFSVFAALERGAVVVAAVRAEQREAALRLGASSVIALGEEDWTGEPFGHVADTVGGPAVAALCQHLTPGGLIRTVSTTPIDPAGLPAEPVFFQVHPDATQLAVIGAAVATGKAAMPIARQLPLAEAAEAHRLVEQGGLGGKIVLAA